MASPKVVTVTQENFEADVLKADKPVLVDYWAEWCGPCKMIAPILDEVSTTYRDKLQIAKMNVDENQQVPAKFGIRGIPTLIRFDHGRETARQTGAVPRGLIDQLLARPQTQ